MKLITAIIQPYKLEEVRAALSAIGVYGMTVTEVEGFGRQRGHAELYRGLDYAVELLPKIKVEIAVDESMMELVTDAIEISAKTGKVGDGKIFVTGLKDVIRIRTGETGVDAL